MKVEATIYSPCGSITFDVIDAEQMGFIFDVVDNKGFTCVLKRDDTEFKV
jgi:hypothetical protein|nr:MAG TPA: hypothetical protein [Caudoviricetes sp.]